MKIGVRREDKHEWEARVPITPEGVRELVGKGLQVVVQPSTIRAFDDNSYSAAGATVQESLEDCGAVFAVKEVPMQLLREKRVYVFFSHTIKGQEHNMPLLRRLMELGCTLIDYERVVDDKGLRLVFFGRHAGLAGMIDTLAVLGQRQRALGETATFGEVKLAYQYTDLDEARREFSGRSVSPDKPFVVGFAGYGNVSKGAQEIYDLFEPKSVDPSELKNIREPGLYKVVFEERHLVEPLLGEFVLQDYYKKPEGYRSVFENHLPHLDVLVNAIYWTSAYPRLLSLDTLRATALPRLRVVGDISCDIDGAVECTVKATTPGQPAYVYEPSSGKVLDGVEGEGLCMMTTDCLPCELPRESSSAFNQALIGLVPAVAEAKMDEEFANAGLPAPLQSATILWRGELTPDYAYLKEHLG